MFLHDALLEYLLGLGHSWVQDLSQGAVDEVPVVVSCSTLLLLVGDVSDLQPQEVSEVLLTQHDFPVLLEAVLHTQLEHRPKAFDGVELGTVLGLEEQLDVQLVCDVLHVLGTVGRVVVQHQHDAFLVGEW